MKRNTRFDKFKIKALEPDLPRLADLTPLLSEIDQTRWYSNFGPLNDRFEQEILKTLDWGVAAPVCSTASNATLALRLAFQAEKLPAGGKVLLPAISFPATLLAIQEAGLTPVIADVDPDLWELTPQIAQTALAEGDYAAVMPVTVFGYPVDASAWNRFAVDHGVKVILDAAPAFGQQPIADCVSAVFSLHATKPLGIGEGGLYVSSNADAIAEFRQLSNFGFDLSRGQVASEGGTNAKLAEMMAAVGLLQLDRRGDIWARRRAILDQYQSLLAGTPISFRVGTDLCVPATLMVDAGSHKPAIQRALKAAAIQSRDWYLPPLHRHPAFGSVARAGDLMTSEALQTRLMGLPFHGFLTAADIDAVAETLKSAL